MSEVLVVIGAGGMGVAIARRLGSGGTTVLADLNADQLAVVEADLAANGHTVVTKTVDVAERSSVAALADFALDHGRVTRVVHTAGVAPQGASLESVMAVDLLGTALVLDEFGKVIGEGGAGVIIASMAGHTQPALDADVERQLATTPAEQLLALPVCKEIDNAYMAYPFAKRANQIRVLAAAKAWAARGARINSISPGVISTSMGHGSVTGETGAIVQSLVRASSAGRLGTPDEIAAAADFLLSTAASFITGTDLLVDGGVVAALRTEDVFGG